MTSVGKDVEELELLWTPSESVKCYSHYENGPPKIKNK